MLSLDKKALQDLTNDLFVQDYIDHGTPAFLSVFFHSTSQEQQAGP